MNITRTATIVVGAGAFAAWLAGAATSNKTAPQTRVPPRRAIDERGAALATEVARLHDRLRPDATPQHPGRNLFTFRTAAAPSTPAKPGHPAPALTEAPPPLAQQPALRLSGISEDPGPNGPVRMAFIAGDGQLFIVKEGDTLVQRYRVTKISADVVELTDITDNSVRRLALR